MQVIDLACICLATWRLSSLITRSQGPLQMFAHLRAKLDPDGLQVPGSLGQLTNCLWCTSVWAAVVLWSLPIEVSYVLAASAVAMAIDPMMPDESLAD